MSASREIELKLEVGAEDVPALKRLPPLDKVRCHRGKQTSIYFDTADGLLREAGLTLRVRQSGRHYLQTIKANGGVAGGGLFDRGEWEQPLDQNQPDLDAVGKVPLGRELDRRKLAKIEPRFETVIERTEWHVKDGDSEFECMLDRGEVVTSQASLPVLELELELKSGLPARLFDFARILNGSVPLRVGVLSKSERGYRLLDGDKRGIVKAEPIVLSGCDTAGEAFQAIAFACVRHLRLNEPLFTEHREGAALHQVRVAVRRLRSAMSLFRPPGADTEVIGSELRWISGLLGAARDLDVFVQKRLKPDESSPALWSQVLGQREAAFDAAIEALESERFRTLMITLVQWVSTGEWLAAAGEPGAWREQPLGDFATTALDRLWRKLRKRGRHLAELEDDQRHRARIAAKKIRYASGFFASLYSGGKSRRRHGAFVAALEELQEQLGSLNDLATADWLAADIASRIRASDVRKELLATIAGDTKALKNKLLSTSSATYDGLMAVGPYWLGQ